MRSSFYSDTLFHHHHQHHQQKKKAVLVFIRISGVIIFNGKISKQTKKTKNWKKDVNDWWLMMNIFFFIMIWLEIDEPNELLYFCIEFLYNILCFISFNFFRLMDRKICFWIKKTEDRAMVSIMNDELRWRST